MLVAETSQSVQLALSSACFYLKNKTKKQTNSGSAVEVVILKLLEIVQELVVKCFITCMCFFLKEEFVLMLYKV